MPNEKTAEIYKKRPKTYRPEDKTAELIFVHEEPGCPGCGSTDIITDYKHGDVVCRNCGLVVSDTIFYRGVEERAYTPEQMLQRARTGSPLKGSKIVTGLTTEIDRYDRDIKGAAVPPERKAQLYRLRKWQMRSKMATSLDRNLSIALPELDRMCSHLDIPENIKENCATTYRKLVRAGVVKGRSIESVVAALVLIEGNGGGVANTLKELSYVSGVGKKDIAKSKRKICRHLGRKLRSPPAENFVPRLVSELGLGGSVEADALNLIKTAKEKGYISGRVPTSSAAMAVYIAAKIHGEYKEYEFRNVCKKYKVFPEAAISKAHELEKELKIKTPLFFMGYLNKIAGGLEFSEEEKRCAIEEIKKAEENEIELSPKTLACSAAYKAYVKRSLSTYDEFTSALRERCKINIQSYVLRHGHIKLGLID